MTNRWVSKTTKLLICQQDFCKLLTGHLSSLPGLLQPRHTNTPTNTDWGGCGVHLDKDHTRTWMSDEELHSTGSHQLSIDWLITGMRSSAPPQRPMGKLLCTVIQEGGAGLSSPCPFFPLLPFHFRPLLIKFAGPSVKSHLLPSFLFITLTVLAGLPHSPPLISVDPRGTLHFQRQKVTWPELDQ